MFKVSELAEVLPAVELEPQAVKEIPSRVATLTCKKRELNTDTYSSDLIGSNLTVTLTLNLLGKTKGVPSNDETPFVNCLLFA